MRLSLRLRILLAFVPLVVFLAAAGVAGLTQLTRTANRIDEILKENYASVKAMVELNEALERIESSFQIARLGHEDDARKAYDQAWPRFNEQFEIEEHNITIFPREQELVDQLRTLRKEYRTQGEKFFKAPNGSPDREAVFLGSSEGPGLRKLFEEIKKVSGEILRINQENMESARDEARKTARTAPIGFCFSLAGLMVPVIGIAWYLLRAILRPIKAVTETAQAIAGSGQLDREVPIFSRDELGQLAEAFNAMTRQLREYRRSNLNQMIRAAEDSAGHHRFLPRPDPGYRTARQSGTCQPRCGALCSASLPLRTPTPGPSGPHPSLCGSLCRMPCNCSGRTIVPPSMKLSPFGSAMRIGLTCLNSGRSAMPMAIRSAPQWCSTTSPGFAFSTSSRATSSRPSAMN